MVFVAKAESDFVAVRLTFLFFFALAANVYFYSSTPAPPTPALIPDHIFFQVTALQCILIKMYDS